MNISKIGLFLCELREEYGLAKKDLAEYMGVSNSLVTKWESGEIGTEQLVRLGEFYGVSIDELYEGKRINEDIREFCIRNYDIPNWNVDYNAPEDIDNYLAACKRVTVRFWELLPKWCLDSLNTSEKTEFEFVERYFDFDIRYYMGKEQTDSWTVSDEDKKLFVKKAYKKLLNKKKEEIAWEMAKNFGFKYAGVIERIALDNDIKKKEVIGEILPQIRKDRLLSDCLLKSRMAGEIIENKPEIRFLIQIGANCIKDYRFIENRFDMDIMEHIEGKAFRMVHLTKMSNPDSDAYSFFVGGWQNESYSQYCSRIDPDLKGLLKSIFDCREKEPLRYYEKLAKYYAIR